VGPPDVLGRVAELGRALRTAGVDAGTGRIVDAVAALQETGFTRPGDTYCALRATLVSRHGDLAVFDRVFASWLGDSAPEEVKTAAVEEQQLSVGERDGETADGEGETAQWSAEERLRRTDFAALTEEERARVERAIERLALTRPLRRSRRLRNARRGHRLDLRRMVRASFATGGEPIERDFRHRKRVPRKLVVLCDLSGSMEVYSRPLLLFVRAIAVTGRGAEAFAFGTRLTKLTEELRGADANAALERVTAVDRDWAAGTRIGDSLLQFNTYWGTRGLARGAVVAIVSDGFERGDVSLLDRELGRLARNAFAVIWVNPLLGDPQYHPLAAGMRTALPHVDCFVSGHSVNALEELAELIGVLRRRHAA